MFLHNEANTLPFSLCLHTTYNRPSPSKAFYKALEP
jgi:hypothetical protein